MRRALAAAGIALLVALANGAAAHAFEPALLAITELADGRVSVRLRSPAPSSEAGTAAPPLEPAWPARCRTIERALADGEGRWLLDCGPAGLAGARVGVRGLAAARTQAVVSFVPATGAPSTLVLTADAPEAVLPGAPGGRGALAIARSYVALGVEHILGGVDHLLFVLGLVLLVRTRGALALAITSFTLAHSVTLALAALGLVAVPQAPLEALVAASIVLVAVELTRPADAPPTLARSRPWVAAFAFGLIHGFGFAGALAERGLPRASVPVALAAFNVGVEIGQLAFVAAVVALAALARRARLAPRPRLVAYAIGAAGAALAIDRALILIG